MNRHVLPLMFATLLLPLGCGDENEPTGPPLVLQPSELCSDHSEHDIATFEDANLEAAITSASGIGGQDNLTCGLISALPALDDSISGPIESLLGIQNLTGLLALRLRGDSLVDISPLSGLTGLSALILWTSPDSVDR